MPETTAMLYEICLCSSEVLSTQEWQQIFEMKRTLNSGGTLSDEDLVEIETLYKKANPKMNRRDMRRWKKR